MAAAVRNVLQLKRIKPIDFKYRFARSALWETIAQAWWTWR